MKKRLIALLLSVTIIMSSFGVGIVAAAEERANPGTYVAAPPGRTVLNFNNNWGYFMGDLKGAEASGYDDSNFANVTIPHTMRLEKKNCGGGANVYQGIGWYRRYFTVDEAYKDKKINIDFEGVMIDSDIYLNGVKLFTRNGGYIGFSIDITDKVKFGEENVLAVRVSSYDSPDTPPGKPLDRLDFHYYGGIYRDVTMRITDKLYISDALQANKTESGGVFVRFEDVSKAEATIQVKTHVVNDGAALSNVTVVSRLVDAGGAAISEETSTSQAFASGPNYPPSLDSGAERIYTQTQDSGELPAQLLEQPLDSGVERQMLAESAEHEFAQTLVVSNPKLWSTDDPYLYRLVSEVYNNGILTDSITTKIGIRTIDFKPDGFYLNGEKEYLRGGNRHQSYQNIGDAASNSMHYRDALQLKEDGFNAVRATHYPQDPAFLDACDELGLLVIECQPGWQNYTNSQKFFDNTMRDIREMIRRDRNRPSVILWETSLNESPMPENWVRTAVKTAREEYPGDQLQLVADYSALNATLYDVCYKVQYKNSGESTIKDQNPNLPFVTREWGDIGGRESAQRKQGEERMLYQVIERQKYLNGDGYDDWGGLDYSPRISGHFLWSWNDYARGSNLTTLGSGTVDIDRYEKYCYYWLKSMQPASRDAYGPMVYVASTNSPTSSLNVQVYSNCDSVSLYQNGTLIATQTREQAKKVGVNDKIMEKGGSPIFHFTLPSFAAGELKAVGNFQGEEVTYSVKTPGEPDHIDIEPALRGINPVADGSDQIPVYFKVVDANGTVVPTYNEKIEITVSGNGALIGKDIPRIGVQSHRPEGGIGFAFVRASDLEGDIKIAATSGTLTGQTTVTTETYTGAYVSVISGKTWDGGVEKFENSTEEYINLAYGKPTTASSEQSSNGNYARNAVDDDPSTKWVADGGTFPQWLQIDLGRAEGIGNFHLEWEESNAVAKYTIETSLDGVKWKTRVDMSENNTPVTSFNEHAVEVEARYIRLNVLSMPSGGWACVREFSVAPLAEGDEAVPGEIIGNTAISSITASCESAEGREPEKLRDDNIFVGTGWLAAPGSATPQSVTVEFNTPQTVYGNRIYWEKDSTYYTYTLEFSEDGEQWETAFKDYTVGGQHYKPEEFDKPFTNVSFARVTLTKVVEASGNPSNKIGMAEWILYGEETPAPEFKEYEYLSDLNWKSASAGYGTPSKDFVSSNGGKIKLLVNGVETTFEKGLFAEANSEFVYNIDGAGFQRLQAYVGVDHSKVAKGGRVVFRVFVDDVQVYESPAKMAKDNCEYIDVDVSGGKELKLTSTYTKNPETPGDIEWKYNGYSDWADAKLTKKARELVSIENPADISVPFGTAFGSIETLPKTVNGTIKGAAAPMPIEVRWVRGNYDGNKAGTYTLDGVLKLPVDVKNNLALVPKLKVIVNEQEPEQPGKEALRTLITSAQEKAADSKYTQESRNALTKVIETAQAVVNDDKATEQEIADAEKALQAAIDALVNEQEPEQPGKEALRTLITSAQEKAADSKYTQESRDALTKVIEIAQAVADNDQATEQEIANAQKALQAAIKALVKQSGSDKPSGGSSEPEHRKHVEPNMVPSSDLSEKLASSSKGTDISVRSDYKVATGFLNDLMKNKDKSVTLNGDWYSWIFDGKNVENNMPGVIWFDTRISTDSPNAEAIGKLTGGADTTNLYFYYEGNLPGETVIRVQLEKYVGKPVYVYYHNPEKGRLELIKSDAKADENGWFEFSITHCSDYVVSTSAIKGAVKVTKSTPEPQKEQTMVNPETGGVDKTLAAQNVPTTEPTKPEAVTPTVSTQPKTEPTVPAIPETVLPATPDESTIAEPTKNTSKFSWVGILITVIAIAGVAGIIYKKRKTSK